MVVMSPLSQFQNKRGRSKRTVELRHLTDDGYNAMASALDNVDWSFIEEFESASDQMGSFQRQLFKMFDQCFPYKRRTFFIRKTGENKKKEM